MVTCGDPGSVRGRCWNGSPYQPVPIAEDVRQSVALRILEQPEDYPGVLAQQQSLRAYPHPYGVNLADVVGYLSPITAGELEQAQKDDDTSLNGASTVGRAGVEQEYDRYLRGRPGYQKVSVDSMGRVLGNSGRVRSTPGDTLVTSIDARVQASPSGRCTTRSRPPARRTTRSPTATTAPTPGPPSCCRRAPAGWWRWPASRRTTRPSGSAASPASSWPGSTPPRPATPCWRGPTRASSRPARRGSRS